MGSALGGTPPPGGYPLRQVEALLATPQEASRLVPHRKGATWGYADTTGVLAVAPLAVHRPALFRDGLSRNDAHILPTQATRLVNSDERVEVLLNARGEYLLIKPDEFAAPGPDGRWRAYNWQQNATQPVLASWAARWDYLPAAKFPPEARTRYRIKRRQPSGNRGRVSALGEGYYTLHVVEKMAVV